MWMIVYLLETIYHFLLQEKMNYQKEFDLTNNGPLGYTNLFIIAMKM
jgi:hypothetical protein